MTEVMANCGAGLVMTGAEPVVTESSSSKKRNIFPVTSQYDPGVSTKVATLSVSLRLATRISKLCDAPSRSSGSHANSCKLEYKALRCEIW